MKNGGRLKINRGSKNPREGHKQIRHVKKASSEQCNRVHSGHKSKMPKRRANIID